jgi:VanZ family protein
MCAYRIKKGYHAAVRRFLGVWLPVALWCALIFWFSSRPDLDLNHLAPRSPWLWWLDWPLRKCAHALEYAVLYVLVRRGWPPAAAWVFCAAYAVSDEWHQTLVPGRDGKISDVLIDCAAAGVAALLRR